MRRGVDVSAFQPIVNWARLRSDGFEFFYARALEGLFVDPMHAPHLAKGRSVGMCGGSYQVGHPSQDADQLCDKFISVGSFVSGQLRPVFDMETMARDAAGHLVIPSNVAGWTDYVCERMKRFLISLLPNSMGARRGPIIYASASYFLEMCRQRASVGGTTGWDWWNADYTGTPNQPQHLGGFTLPPYVAHQYAGNVALDGQVGLWDLDAIYDDDYGFELLKL